MKIKAKPFLKWAGGKGQLLEQFERYYPTDLQFGKVERYIEPFVGGGAVFFEIMQKFKPRLAFISDINKDLILTYIIVQQKSDELLIRLEEFQRLYYETDTLERQEFFLKIRETFNSERSNINYKTISDNWISRASQLIFLNKTCFNGLFRLNSKGDFNVPFGKYEKPNICDKINIKACSEVLKNTQISVSSYEKCFENIDNQSFVYLDPPYRPLSKTANFTTYAGMEFRDQEQIRLAEFFNKIHKEKRAKLMLSNSDPKNESPEDVFFDNIYSDFNIHRVKANRSINSKGDKRGAINEIIVTNYKPQSIALTLSF